MSDSTGITAELSNSPVQRQNILNNPYAIQEIQKAIGIQGIPFENRYVITKEMAAGFFEVTPRTIDNYLQSCNEELVRNGYEVLRGKRLATIKLAIQSCFGNEMDFITKTTALGVFDFKAFLDLGMLLRESDKAQILRKTILDIVIDTINIRTGGSTKYINRRDEDFIYALFEEENYRKEFTDALKKYVVEGNFKYAVYTDKIYKSIFKENAKEYRAILKLQEKDKTRDTFYAEILDLIASYEGGFADRLKKAYEDSGHLLSYLEADKCFIDFESEALWQPLIRKARNKMASRDLAFRDAFHERLKEYISEVRQEDFERFLGEQSREFDERLEDAKDTMKRLKERQ